MRKTREILRLHFESHLIPGQIASICKVSRSTVQRCLERLRAAGLSWPLPTDVDDAALEQRLSEPVWVTCQLDGAATRMHYPRTMKEDVRNLLERFVQARLLVSRTEGAERILEVAHEALFRSWDRLVAWLNADREFLLWRQRLRGDIAEWERNKHDENTLLRGPVLAEAGRWLVERPDDLNEAEREFIRASVALQEQEQAAELLKGQESVAASLRS